MLLWLPFYNLAELDSNGDEPAATFSVGKVHKELLQNSARI